MSDAGSWRRRVVMAVQTIQLDRGRASQRPFIDPGAERGLPSLRLCREEIGTRASPKRAHLGRGEAKLSFKTRARLGSRHQRTPVKTGRARAPRLHAVPGEISVRRKACCATVMRRAGARQAD